MTDPEDLLSIKEAAQLLRVSETSLRRWTNSGALDHLRIGGKRERRFRRSDLLAFLQSASVGQPEVRVGKQGFGVGDFLFGGLPAKPGTHVCGISTSEATRSSQAAHFLYEGLRGRRKCLLVTSPGARRAILADLERRMPSVESEIQSGLLVGSDYASSGAAQVEYFEDQLGKAVHAGARSLYVIGDLSGGGPEPGVAFSHILEYEYEYERRIAQKFPVVTLCQYDARRLSGPEVLATLQAHPDVLRYSSGSLLV